MQVANKIAFNTGILYAKMAITIGLSLYTTRLVLSELGVNDFGVYNLIAGIIALFAFLSSSFSNSIQRYLAFHIGANNTAMVKKVFFTSGIIHLILASFVALVLFLLSFFLFNGSVLNIDPARMDVAKNIYYYTIFAAFFTILTPTFGAMITAKEDIIWMALVYTLEAFIKFGIAIYISYSTFDKLEIYGFLMSVQPIFSFTVWGFICYKKYEECNILKKEKLWDNLFFKEISAFIGWTLLGNSAKMIKDQGAAVVFNVFFGTVINAAYGIAMQITNQLNFFSGTLQGTTNPQIMKSEGSGDRERTIRLSILSSKLGFFLLAIIAVPTIFETKPLLHLWLKNTPEYTILFCKLTLIGKLIEQMTSTTITTFLAVGKIKYYQISSGIITILSLPIAYILLKIGYSANYVLFSFVLLEIVLGVLRLFFLKSLAGVSLKKSFINIIIRELIILPLPLIACFYIYYNIDENVMRLFITFSTSIILFIFSFYLLGLNATERNMIKNISIDFYGKISKKVKNNGHQ